MDKQQFFNGAVFDAWRWFGAHLGGGGARKGDDQHPVDAGATLHNQAHDALHQHGRFSTARRSRYQQFAVAGLDGGFLRRGKAHVHRSFPR